MKKLRLLLIMILAGTVTFSAGLWMYSTKSELGTKELFIAGLVFVLVIFSLIVGLKKMKNVKKGLPIDDELSNSIKQKAAAMAFMYSFYMWLFIIIFMSDKTMRVEIPVGIGIVGMGLLFFGFWAYYSIQGVNPPSNL